MGFFSRLFGRRAEQPATAGDPVVFLPGPGTFSLPIVGESKYQAALGSICGPRSKDGENRSVEALLVLEDSNPYDPKAVRVDIQGKTVGYLSREYARQYRKRLEKTGYARAHARCRALIRGGWDRGRGDRGHYGVSLDLPMGNE